jgi:hypothetical protein
MAKFNTSPSRIVFIIPFEARGHVPYARTGARLLQALTEIDLKKIKAISGRRPARLKACQIMSKQKITHPLLLTRPPCVLIFEECDHDSTITYKTDTLTEWEHEFIMQISTVGSRHDEITMAHRFIGYPNHQVHAALMLGFRFQDDASRERWKNRKDFEMYRDAVHGIA